VRESTSNEASEIIGNCVSALVRESSCVSALVRESSCVSALVRESSCVSAFSERCDMPYFTGGKACAPVSLLSTSPEARHAVLSTLPETRHALLYFTGGKACAPVYEELSTQSSVLRGRSLLRR
jgi:hypothetical protein